MRFLIFMFLLGLYGSTTALEKSYFQQYVNYTIDARLNDFSNSIEGKEQLLYVNNSPDTLKEMYFYLYFNRYKEGAYTEYNQLREKTLAEIIVNKITINGKPAENYITDKTIMKISPEEYIAPGDSVRFYFEFDARLPYASDRYGYMGNHYDVGNWFLTPVVYDKEGWHLNQHVDNEFYQEWGDFEVNITVPKGFIVGATGTLQNPEEAMQDTTQKVRDWYTHNMDDTTQTTTWKYKAWNVHDFAWVADPEFRYITKTWNGINVHYLVMRHNYDAWKEEIEAGVGAVRYFSEQFGPYPYDQITVADTYMNAGGMEYPNIVFINTYISPKRSSSFFRAVVIHEIAHNWFYGLLANNQTEFEWMDEGFTQFAEILGMEDVYGIKNNYSVSGRSWVTRHFGFERDDRLATYLNALYLVKSGREDDPINTMPDKFGYGVYTSQYDKMSIVLFMLENVMGSEKFWLGMKNYYKEWHFKHPQPDDFKHVMENAYGGDLDWFFKEWIYSTRYMDYAVEDVENTENDGVFQSEIKLKNMGTVHTPLDIMAILKNGDSLYYKIPTEIFQPRISGKNYLDVWHFSLKDYNTTLQLKSPVDEIIIDPQNVMLDINQLNNSSRIIPKMDFYFMKRQSYASPLNKYLWESWPSVMYNDVDKFKLGLANYGGYLNRDHLIDLKIWYNTNNNTVDFSTRYEHPLRWLGQSRVYLSGYQLEGRQGADLKMRFNQSRDTFYYLNFKHYNLYDDAYPAAPWNKGRYNTVDLNLNFYNDNKDYNFYSYYVFDFKNSLAGSEQNFSSARMDVAYSLVSSESDFVFDIKLKAGTAGSSTPVQEQFNLAGASSLRQFDQPFYRSRGALPVQWSRNGHLFLDDYAKVRGVSLFNNSYQQYGNNILAFSFDLTTPNPFLYLGVPYLEDFDYGLFFDNGIVWNGDLPKYDQFLKSTGFSVTLPNLNLLKSTIGLQEIKFDFPVWIGKNSQENKDFGLRWLVSFNFDIETTPIL
ncbi:MAG: hypothetical protein KDF60_07665 [Calditrichaeota bacterium]|nr:hypothetical protein [Calditrichota bacterium]